MLAWCLADRRWGSCDEGRGEAPICDNDIDDDDDVEGMEAAAATKALARNRGAAPLLQRRGALDAVATAAADVQLPCTPLTARI